MNDEVPAHPRTPAPSVQPVRTSQPEAPRNGAARLVVRARQLAAAVFLLVVIAVVANILLPGGACACDHDDLTHVTGYGGGLKVDFLNDPAVQDILAERYHLQVDVNAVGSLDITCNVPLMPEDDFLWLGDSVALEQYRQCGGAVRRAESIYYSPLVLSSWAPVVDALVAQGVARLETDGSYSVEFAKLIALVEQGQTWADIGLPDLHGKISVQTTDPRRSNVGFLFAALLANTMNGGAVVDPTTVTPLLPRIQAFFLRIGNMPGRSSELWKLFLVTGMNAKPIVALPESQIVDYVIANPSQLNSINQNIRILYPQPTVLATHPFVARTEEGERLMEALLDPAVQRLAAENHAQRPSVASVAFAPNVAGIRTNITSVVGLPSWAVMDQILAAIREATSGGETPSPATSPTTLTPVAQKTRHRSRPR